MRCLALQSQKQSGCSSGPPPALPLRCPGGGGHPGSPRRPAHPAPTPTPWPLRHLLLGPCLRAQTDGWEGGWGPAVLPALPGLKLSLGSPSCSGHWALCPLLEDTSLSCAPSPHLPSPVPVPSALQVQPAPVVPGRGASASTRPPPLAAARTLSDRLPKAQLGAAPTGTQDPAPPLPAALGQARTLPGAQQTGSWPRL